MTRGARPCSSLEVGVLGPCAGDASEPHEQAAHLSLP